MSVTTFSIKYLKSLLVKKEYKEACEACKDLWRNPHYKCNLEFCLIYEYATKKAHFEEDRLLPIIGQQIRNCKVNGNQIEINYAIKFAKEEFSQRNIHEAKEYLEKAMKLCGITNEFYDNNEIIENAIKISWHLLDKVDQSNYEVHFDNCAKMLTLYGRIAYEHKDFKSALIYFVSANHIWWKKNYTRKNMWRNCNTLFILKSLSASKSDKASRKKMLSCILRNKYLDFDAEYGEELTLNTNYEINLSSRLWAIPIYFHFGNKIHDLVKSQLSSF